jgi:hypothetical protein
MEVRYSKHLEVRLRMRGIPYELPRIIFENSRRRLYDVESGFNIAVLRVRYFGKQRDVMVAYQVNANNMRLVTIHPLKTNQLENRLRSGRWKKI